MSAIDDKVQQLANDGFDVGTPLTTQGTDDTGRSWQQFTNAWLLAEPGDTGVWIIWGTTLTTYNDTGGISTHGYPLTAQAPTGRDDITTWDFTSGSRIYEINGDTGAAYMLSPPLLTRYDELGGPTGPLGGPACTETFTNGTWWTQTELGDGLYTDTTGNVHHLSPTIQHAYWDNGGPNGELGIPTSDWFASDQGDGAEGATFTNATFWVQPDGTTFMQSVAPAPAGAWPRFANGSEADAWFAAHTSQATFIDWFVANHAGKQAWAGRSSKASAHGAFLSAWSDLPRLIDRDYVTLPDFLTLASVMINETGGTFVPLSEGVGTTGHPGIAYAFDSIATIPKASYNTAPNRTALALFSDAEFLATHGTLAQADRVRNSTDARWGGSVYPTPDFPTSTDPAVSGIILEADFYKFRGRGVIQTTWRSGYDSLVRYIQGYTGSEALLLQYQAAWAGVQSDVVCTRSTNADWDALFQQSNFELAREAVRRHNASKDHYFWLSEDRAVLDGAVGTKGTIRFAGRAVSGSGAYGNLLRDRVFQMLTALGL